MKTGKLIIFSGFSGTGKGTIMNELLTRYPDEFCLSVSATTRSPREGEKEGVAYFFKNRDEFEKMISQDAFLEYAEYVGNYYGTPKEYVEQKLNSGKNVFLEIEMQGAMKVKEKLPQTVLVFILPPSVKTLVQRLRDRGTNSEDNIRQRMLQAKSEAENMDKYDYFVINDSLDKCIEDVRGIVDGNIPGDLPDKIFLDNIRTELEGLLKGDL